MFKEGKQFPRNKLCYKTIGKWDRVGELFKSVEDGKESESGRKSLAYNRRTFYLGKDILYYISKERNFTCRQLPPIAMQKVNVIPLQYAKVTAGKDLKDSKPIIKISLPSTPALLLKASSQADFVMWYNNIQLSTINAHTKKKLEDFEKALVRLEQEVARTDKKEVASFFTGIDAVLKSEESRSAVFENLQNYKPEYLYLGELYDILQTFDTMCKLGKYNDALSCGKRVYKMLTNFNLKEMSEEDKDFLNEQILEDEVRHMMKSLVSEEIVGKIAKTLEEIEKEGPEKIKEVENVLFSDVTSNLLEKVKAARSEIRAFSRNKITIQDLKLMTIPVSRQKKSLQWTKPKLLREFGVREENFLRFKPASVRLPGYSRNGGMLLAKGASSVITFRRHDISDLETTGAFIDTREDTGMLDM
eukprot:TRINITY_DN2010_c0_g1_i1.p3 TRINITY_DN2010_c0_g1~~TRINITY_DN2010_c0_g1_i1.p3  ORF type:complete len:417 (-),score=46.26 TRINITY_DN2010_c0_g1_i1:937-2187(-)